MRRSREIEHFCLLISFSSIILTVLGFNPADNYLIDCGSLANTTIGNRIFIADKLGSSFVSSSKEIFANTSDPVSSDGSRLYQTARIFDTTSNYNFPIRKGRHWIRFYFYPFNYSSYNLKRAVFDVSTQDHMLLRNFTVNSTVFKEFSLNVTTNDLVITFTPVSNSFAFLNAIEVVSAPDWLITDTASTFNPKGTFNGLLWQAFETVFRLNMGGPRISPRNDTLQRTWMPDQDFLVEKNLATNVTNLDAVQFVDGGATPEIAPSSVYGTATRMNSDDNPQSKFNVTWRFDIEPGYRYLARFHFCDIVSTALNQLYFNVYIGSSSAVNDLDLSTVFNTLAAAYYVDFVTPPSVSNQLRVSIGPSNDIPGVYPNAILNGFEIMKMNNSDGSLGGPGVVPGSGSKKNVGAIVGVTIASVAIFVFCGVLCVLCRNRKRYGNHQKSWIPLSFSLGNSQTMGSKCSNGTTTSINSNLEYRIPFAVVQECTGNFDESRIIGVGGFGTVFKGVMRDGMEVAVKRGNPRSQQGIAEFRTEIEMLSQFRHRHLVSLMGYCDERNEMILIYEFMENGTLKNHLYGSECTSLNWKQRLEICIGAARGLHYLHTGYAKPVIHRDVKSANILLDQNFMAKVADFGLSKTGPEIDQTHVSTAVKGSFGYLDPEYFRRQQLTEKSDVYSFGVVLLEVLCARPVIDPTLPREMVNLAEWAMKWQKRGQLEQIIDPSLKNNIKPDSLKKYAETAEKCLADFGVDRPSMGDVLWNLEYALQLQEAVSHADVEDNSTNMIGQLGPQVNDFNNTNVDVSTTQHEAYGVEDLSGVSMSRVFSQLVKSEGR